MRPLGGPLRPTTFRSLDTAFYMYIEREREKERETSIYIYVYLSYIFIYLNIKFQIERWEQDSNVKANRRK